MVGSRSPWKMSDLPPASNKNRKESWQCSSVVEGLPNVWVALTACTTIHCPVVVVVVVVAARQS